MQKKYLTFIYLFINIIIIVIIGALDPQLKNIGKVIFNIDPIWVLGGVLCILVFWFLDATIIYFLITMVLGKKFFLKSLKISIIGKYYNAVTPFASGGQPCQILYMMQSGISAGYATSTLIVKFLVYQGVLSIYAVIAFIYKASFIRSYSSLLFWASVLGFFFNFAGPLLVYLLSVNEKFINTTSKLVLGFLKKVHIIKNVEMSREKLLKHIRDFHDSIYLLKGSYDRLITIVIITAIEIFFYLSIPYFIYRGCGLTQTSWIDITVIYIFLYMAVSFFPTPGASGASEGGFYVLFKLFFTSNVIFISMLLWRVITYYLIVAIGGMIILGDSIHQISRSYLPDRN